MSELSKVFQIIDTITFEEVRTDLYKSELINEYSKLSFNDGFIFKTFEAREKDIFKEVLSKIKKLEENHYVNDFIYSLIQNESLKATEWEIYDFLEISEEFNSTENFRKLLIFELNKIKLEKRLSEIVRYGSIYDEWKLSERLTKKAVSEFVNDLFQKDEKYLIFEFQKWGDHILGFFEGFLLINISKYQITFFAKDDYD